MTNVWLDQATFLQKRRPDQPLFTVNGNFCAFSMKDRPIERWDVELQTEETPGLAGNTFSDARMQFKENPYGEVVPPGAAALQIYGQEFIFYTNAVQSVRGRLPPRALKALKDMESYQMPPAPADEAHRIEPVRGPEDIFLSAA